MIVNDNFIHDDMIFFEVVDFDINKMCFAFVHEIKSLIKIQNEKELNPLNKIKIFIDINFGKLGGV